MTLAKGVLLLAMLTTGGCCKSDPTGAPSPPMSSPPSASAQGPHQQASGSPSASSVTQAVDPNATFLGAPAPTTLLGDTIFGAGGVYFGLPPEWTAGDVYNQYMMYHSERAKAMVYLVTATDISPAKLDAFTKDAAYPAYLKDPVWDTPWQEVSFGPGYQGRIRRGHGLSVLAKNKPRAAIAIGMTIPARKMIHILGSWDEPSETSASDFVEVIKGVGRCVHKANRGCVPVAPTGDEAELPNPPKRGRATSPWG